MHCLEVIRAPVGGEMWNYTSLPQTLHCCNPGVSDSFWAKHSTLNDTGPVAEATDPVGQGVETT